MGQQAVRPTLEEIRTWPATVGIDQAAVALGYSKSWAYQLAAQDEFPCKLIKLGAHARVRVVTASLVKLLDGS